MKICCECNARFSMPTWQCPICHFSPAMINSYPAFAPDLAFQHEGFNPEFFSQLSALEAKNFWFQARNQLIVWAIRKYFPHLKNFLEIGCGTGFVLSGIQEDFPEIDIFGSEIFSEGLSYAVKRVAKAQLIQMDGRHIPFETEFDVIGAFDVLEHIEEDEAVLKQMYKAIRPRGGIILTVPQHKFLWSKQDEYACHVRRYTANELKQKVLNAGFKIVKTSSFISFLFPLMLASRLIKNKSKTTEYDVLSELRLPTIVNNLFRIISSIEYQCIRIGANLPIGGSLFLVAYKADK